MCTFTMLIFILAPPFTLYWLSKNQNAYPRITHPYCFMCVLYAVDIYVYYLLTSLLLYAFVFFFVSIYFPYTWRIYEHIHYIYISSHYEIFVLKYNVPTLDLNIYYIFKTNDKNDRKNNKKSVQMLVRWCTVSKQNYLYYV